MLRRIGAGDAFVIPKATIALNHGAVLGLFLGNKILVDAVIKDKHITARISSLGNAGI